MSASLFAQAMREFFHHHRAWPVDFFEQQLSNTYSRFLEPGNVVFDVGAHTGYHAIRVLEQIGETGEVYCFEPLPEIFEQLNTNLSRFKNARLFNGVLSDTIGKLSFERAIGLPGESGLRKRQRYDLPDIRTETLIVQSTTLDDMTTGIKRLDYIKIDTEGAELTILAGGKRTLLELRPVVSVEWGSDTYLSYGHTAASLFDFSRQHGYSIFDLFGNIISSRRQWLEVSDRAAWDFILVPDEKLSWYIYKVNI